MYKFFFRSWRKNDNDKSCRTIKFPTKFVITIFVCQRLKISELFNINKCTLKFKMAVKLQGWNPENLILDYQYEFSKKIDTPNWIDWHDVMIVCPFPYIWCFCELIFGGLEIKYCIVIGITKISKILRKAEAYK